LPTGAMINICTSNNVKLPMVVSDDGDSMIFIWVTQDEPTGFEAQAFATQTHDIFMELVDEWARTNGLSDQLAFRATMSLPEVVMVALDTVKSDFESVDMVSLPLAIITLYFIVGSGRLLVVTGVGLLVSTICSCGFLSLLSHVATMEAITPVLVMALLVALSVDYSLFILTRFCSELVQAHSADVGLGRLDEDVKKHVFTDAIAKTMSTSGATIIVSGLILVVSFIFLAMFPVNLIANLGLGCALALLTMIAVNLTFVPAFMSLFHVFFSGSISPKRMGARSWRCCTNSAVRRAMRVGSQANVVGGNPNSCWTKLAKLSTTRPTNIIILVVVVAFTGCFAWPCLYLETTVDLRQNLPHGTDVYRTTEILTGEFGGGTTNPYNALLLPKNRDTANPTPILSSQFFKDSHDMLSMVNKELKKRMPAANGTGFYFISYQAAPTVTLPKIPYPILGAWCGLPGYRPLIANRPECNIINMFINTDDFRDASKAPTATTGFIMPSVDPFSVDGELFLNTIRDVIDDISPAFGIDVYIVGTAVYGTDMVTSVYKFFPMMIVATLLCAGVVMGITFKSVVIPVRAVLSNILTLGFTYGIAVMVYQFGILDWMHWQAVDSELKALPWIIPVITFFVLTGLSLDYDIFLTVRITELRSEGLSPTEAIQQGLVSTAGIISSAGVIMMFTFGVMIISSLLVNNVMSLMMVAAVFYLSIIGPTLINPNIMSLLGHWNWWPSANSKPDPDPSLGVSLQQKDVLVA